MSVIIEDCALYRSIRETLIKSDGKYAIFAARLYAFYFPLAENTDIVYNSYDCNKDRTEMKQKNGKSNTDRNSKL